MNLKLGHYVKKILIYYNMRIVVSLIIFFLFFIFNFFKKEKFQCKSRCSHLDKSNCLSILNIFTDRKCIWNNELGKCYDYKEGILNYGKTLPVTATVTTATGTTATGGIAIGGIVTRRTSSTTGTTGTTGRTSSTTGTTFL